MVEVEESWDDWEEEIEDSIQCLFCTIQCTSMPLFLSHAITCHEFDLIAYQTKFHNDVYANIRMINMIRTMVLESNNVLSIKEVLNTKGSMAFENMEYMKPVLPNDALLYCMEVSDDEEEPCHEATIQCLQDDMEVLKDQLTQCREMLQCFGEEATDMTEPVAKDNDTYYFDSYSAIGIHREMLQDKIRTDSYMSAILQNTPLFQDKIVLDVGCGTGILSMFAAQAGAAKVIAVDCSDMLDLAQEIIHDNGFEHVIIPIKGKLENLELPVEKVDIIISEWMGYCLLYESMLDTVLYARDKWLQPSGYLFPDQASMFLQGFEDSKHTMTYWDNVYGFNMQAMKKLVNVKDPKVEILEATCILTNRAPLIDICIDTIQYDELNYETSFTLCIQRDGVLAGFVSSFDIAFQRDCQQVVSFSTGVESTPTHWQQTVFYLDEPISVTQDTTVTGTWSLARNATNPRYLDIVLSWSYDSISGTKLFTLT